MMAIEKTPHGSFVFLTCGCGATRLREHPTGAAFLVKIQKACASHVAEKERIRAVLRGELVSPFTRELANVS
jgi:hypothetical protein